MENRKPESTLAVVHVPGEDHPGQTVTHGNTHDREGSQLESERHQYPNGNIPKAGSVRSNKRPRIKRSGT